MTGTYVRPEVGRYVTTTAHKALSTQDFMSFCVV